MPCLHTRHLIIDYVWKVSTKVEISLLTLSGWIIVLSISEMNSTSSTSALSSKHELKYLTIPGKAIFSWLNTWPSNLEMLDVVNMIYCCYKSGGKHLKFKMRRQWQEDFSPPYCYIILVLKNMNPKRDLALHSYLYLFGIAWVNIQCYSPVTVHFTSHLPRCKSTSANLLRSTAIQLIVVASGETEVFCKAQEPLDTPERCRNSLVWDSSCTFCTNRVLRHNQ